MLLVIDVGNTQTVLGVFDGEELVDHWRIATNPERTSDESALLVQQLLGQRGIDGRELDGIAVASVVPLITASVREATRRYFGKAALVVEPGVRTGVPVLIDNPKEVGADRIVNAVAAIESYALPAIIVDLGTATTFDVVSHRGEYLGGVILPGVEVSAEALVRRTAALRRVELVEPRNVIGRSTVEAIQSGLMYGAAATVDGLCRRISTQLEGEPTVVATGGLARVIAPLTEMITEVDPWLTLRGLRLVWERNR